MIHIVVQPEVSCHTVNEHPLIGGHLRELFIMVTEREDREKSGVSIFVSGPEYISQVRTYTHKTILLPPKALRLWHLHAQARLRTGDMASYGSDGSAGA